MVVNQRSGNGRGRKPTGGRFKQYRRKKQHESGSKPMETRVGKVQKRTSRKLGGETKTKLFEADVANLFDPKTKTHSQVKIKVVLENNANRHYVRRNVMTQGTLIETEKGTARVTNRPGQEGAINAVLV